MKKNKPLSKSLTKFYGGKQDAQELLFGELGIPINGVQRVDVPGRPGYVYVRIRGNNSELIQAYNSTVPTKYDYPVVVSRKGNSYIIAGRDQGKYSNMGNIGATVGTTPLPNHGGQHSFNPSAGMGADPTWVFPQQFMPNLAYPSGSSMMLTIHPHFYEWEGQWKYTQSTGTPDLTPYVPTITGSARMALVFVNGDTGALEVAGGVGFSGGINNAHELAQYIPDVDRNNSIPLAAVKLGTGTTQIDWSDIYDMRDFYTVAKHFEGIAIQDSTVPQGTGTVLNFGDNLTVSMVGNVATIDGQAGGGGGSAILAQDEGVLLGTGTIFNFTGNGVDATISGTVFNINIPGGGTGTATYFRVGQPTPLLSTTGTYWMVDEPYATGTLAVFNQGHALIIDIDYSEQYPQSGTYQYTEAQPTGTYHLAMYGASIPDVGSSSSAVGGTTLISTETLSVTGSFSNVFIPSGYDLIRVVARVRTAEANATDRVGLRVGNGSLDTGNNYAYSTQWTGASSGGSNSTSASFISSSIIPGNTAAAGFFGTAKFEIHNPDDVSQWRQISTDGGHADGTGYRTGRGNGVWKNAADVIDILNILGVATAAFVPGSRLDVIGEIFS